VSEKSELQLEPLEGELQPKGKMPKVTPEQMNLVVVNSRVSV
jgi:hypothetical protein